MKYCKRIFAIVITIVMIATLVSFSGSAEEDLSMFYEIRKTSDGTETVDEIKAGKTVYVDCYVSDATYVFATFEWEAKVGELTADNVTFNIPGYSGTGFNNAGHIYLNYFSQFEVDGTPIATVELTIPEDAETTDVYDLIEGKTYAYTVGSSMGNGILDKASIGVFESFTATKAEAVVQTVSYPIGTDVISELADAEIIVKSDDESKSEGAYKAEWDCEYDNTVPGVYDFVGTVIPPTDFDEVSAYWSGDLEATVKIELTALTDGAIISDNDIAEEIKAERVNREVDDSELIEMFADRSFVISDGNGIEDEIIPTSWEVKDKSQLDVTVVDTSATIVAKFASGTESENAKFELEDEKTVEFTVVIIPAYILGDTNLNDEVDPLDWMAIANHLSDLIPNEALADSESLNVKAADVNCNGVLDPLDWMAIANHLSGLIPSDVIGKPVK